MEQEEKVMTFHCPICGEKSHVLKIEAENRRLEDQLKRTQGYYAAMQEALDKLARLGNEPHFGNSRGNVIAKAALEKHDGK
jgi:uncharacterized Zn finger protein (UPF0148 family)